MTFVLDTEKNDYENSYGNEAKMQKIWQCMPLRPQRIFILGATMVKRVLINAALALASLFTNEKVTVDLLILIFVLSFRLWRSHCPFCSVTLHVY